MGYEMCHRSTACRSSTKRRRSNWPICSAVTEHPTTSDQASSSRTINTEETTTVTDRECCQDYHMANQGSNAAAAEPPLISTKRRRRFIPCNRLSLFLMLLITFDLFADVRWCAAWSLPTGNLYNPTINQLSTGDRINRLAKRASASDDENFMHFSFAAEPRDVVVARGERAFLHCTPSLQALGAEWSVQWRRNDQIQNIPSVDADLHLYENGTLRVSIDGDRAESTQAGVYQCVVLVKYKDNSWTFVSRKAKLQIAVLPRFDEQPYDRVVSVGMSVLLPCRVTDAMPPPEVLWYKDNAPLDVSGDSRVSVLPLTGSLEIHAVTLTDAGQYKCRLTNTDKSRHSTQGTLTVNTDDDSLAVEPRFETEPRGQVVRVGQTAVLECVTNGQPTPNVQWLKDGVHLNEDTVARYSTVGHSSLMIQKLQLSDTGTYTCRASNAEDAVDANAALEIIAPPAITSTPLSVVMKETADVQFECVTQGRPGPSVSWYKNGETIIPSDYFRIESDRLRVLGLVRGDQGVYQCLAENAAGSMQAGAQLVVEMAEYLYPIYREVYPEYVDSNDDGVSYEVPGNNVPSEVRHVRSMTVASRYVALQWTAPAHTYGPVVQYLVFYKRHASERERVTNSTEEQVSISHLEPASQYHFRVVAVNKQGRGTSSKPLSVFTMAEQEVPGKVVSLTASALSPTSIRVHWQPPNDDTLVQYYKLFYAQKLPGMNPTREDETEIQVSDVEYTLHGLDKFSTYTVRVEAHGQNGPGFTSDIVDVRTFSDIPGAPPSDVTADATGTRSILITWRPPDVKNQNGLVTGYRIRWKLRRRGARSKSVMADAKDMKYELSEGLQPGTNYVVRMQTVNVNGSGPHTDWIRVSTFMKEREENSVPGAPTTLKPAAESTAIAISWTPPLDDGIMVRGYMVGWGVGVPDLWTKKLDANQRYFRIEGLDASREYVISLRAYNMAGNGFPIYESVRTLPHGAATSDLGQDDDYDYEVIAGAPLQRPHYLRAVTLSSVAIKLIWTDQSLSDSASSPQRPHDGRYYNLRYTDHESANGLGYHYKNASETAFVVDELRPNTQYEFAVRVVLGGRASGWSMDALNTTDTASPTSAPRDLTVVPAPNGHPLTVMLNWQPPKFANGPIAEYIMYYTHERSLPISEWTLVSLRGDRLTTSIGNLLPQTTYYFKIHARNDRGYSPMSEMVHYRTVTGGAYGNKQADGSYPALDTSHNRNTGTGDADTDANRTQMIMVLIIGALSTIMLIALLAMFAWCCVKRRRGRRHGYVQGKQTEVKPPPDLWIDHKHDMHSERMRDGRPTPTDSMQEMKHGIYASTPDQSDNNPRYHSLAELRNRGQHPASYNPNNAKQQQQHVRKTSFSTTASSSTNVHTPSLPPITPTGNAGVTQSMYGTRESTSSHSSVVLDARGSTISGPGTPNAAYTPRVTVPAGMVLPRNGQDSGVATASDAESGGTLSRSYHHQSSGSSLDLQHQPMPGTARQRTPQVVYTGARHQQPATIMIDGSMTARHVSPYQSTAGLVPTPPPQIPNGGPPALPPDGTRTLTKRNAVNNGNGQGTNGHPLSSFAGMSAPPPPAPNQHNTGSPRTHIVRPVINAASPARIQGGVRPVGAATTVKTATVHPNTTRQPSLPADNTLSCKENAADALQHSYSTEELAVQMQNLDVMIDDLQAMQAEFSNVDV